MKWAIRWDTQHRGAGSYGGVLPCEPFAARAEAEQEAQRLQAAEPMRPSPFGGTAAHPVTYSVFALASGQEGLPLDPLLERLRGTDTTKGTG